MFYLAMNKEHIVGLGMFGGGGVIGGSYCELLGDLMHSPKVMWSGGDGVIWGVRWQV